LCPGDEWCSIEFGGSQGEFCACNLSTNNLPSTVEAVLSSPVPVAITESIDAWMGRGVFPDSEAGERGVMYSTYDGVAVTTIQ
jgi:hypothetical protein